MITLFSFFFLFFVVVVFAVTTSVGSILKKRFPALWRRYMNGVESLCFLSSFCTFHVKRCSLLLNSGPPSLILAKGFQLDIVLHLDALKQVRKGEIRVASDHRNKQTSAIFIKSSCPTWALCSLTVYVFIDCIVLLLAYYCVCLLWLITTVVFELFFL